MGGRGAFIDVNTNNFSFVENGQIYHTIGFDGEIKYLIQENGKGGKKIPDYSHSLNGIYALLVDGKIKSVGIYENHKKTKSIDLSHSHYEPILGKVLHWHYHTDLYHKEPAHELSLEDEKLIKKILEGVKKYL